MWPWLLGGVVLVGGGYFAYQYYEQQQAATPIGQLKSTISDAVTAAAGYTDTAVTLASGGDQSKAVEAAELALPFVNPAGTYHAAKNVVSEIGSWF